jgi:peroxiredoxin
VRSARAWTGVALSAVGLVMSAAMLALVLWAIHLTGSPARELEARNAVWRGSTVPDVELTTLDGERIRLADLRGRRVVVNLWATWCGPCRRELPHFAAFARRTPREQVVVIGVSKEGPGVLRPFVEKERLGYPIASADTGTWPEPFASVRSIPTTFFIDRNGLIQFVKVGYLSEEKLAALATAKDLPARERGVVERVRVEAEQSEL